MTHIGVALLKDGEPTGKMKALCGAVCSSLSDGGEMCPTCVELNKRG